MHASLAAHSLSFGGDQQHYHGGRPTFADVLAAIGGGTKAKVKLVPHPEHHGLVRPLSADWTPMMKQSYGGAPQYQ